MEVIKDFGLNPFLLGAQIVNFLIVLYLLKRFLYKPVLEMLKNREDSIREGLSKAEEARLLLEKTKEEEREVIRKAKVEAEKLIANAKDQSLALVKEAEKETKRQAEKILNEARSKIEYETKQVETRLMSNVSAIALKLLEKSAKQLFSEKEQEQVVKRALKELPKSD